MPLHPHLRSLAIPIRAGALLALLLITLTAAEPGPAIPGLAARVERIREEKRNDTRLNALGELANNLSLAEIPEAVRLAGLLPTLRERLALGDSALRRWGELAPADAFAHVATLPEGYSKVEIIRSVAGAFAKKDGPAAVGAAMNMPPGRARMEAIQAAVETWAGQDVRAALQWADTLPAGVLREAVLRKISFVWVHADPVAASAVVPQLPVGDARNALLTNIATNWAVIDPEGAIRWARALPGAEEQELAQVMAIESWADSDPLAACRFAQKLTSTSLRQRALLAALDRWTTQDPQQAFQWASRQGDRFLSERGVPQVLNMCASVCPDAAAQWVEQLPVGPIRDHAIGAFVESAHPWNPAVAARMAVLTSDPAVRQQRVEPCLRLWFAWDPEPAKRWLAETDFPNEIKGAWLAGQPTPRP